MDIAKLVSKGSNQSVRLPKEYRFDGTEVYIKRIGEMVVLIPKKALWNNFSEGIWGFSEDYLADRQQPPAQKREFPQRFAY